MEKLRIVLADDHTMIRVGLRALIEAQPDMEVVAETDNGHAALEVVRKLKPGVLILDISMPEMNGLRTMEQVQREELPVKVLVLSAYSDTAYLRQMLAAGASGYLQKKAAPEELVKALRTIVAGGVFLDPALAGAVTASFVQQKRLRGTRQGAELSEREREVLRAVALGFTNKEIADQLRISVKTVETHKANFMEKLELRSRAEVVRYAMHQGWLVDA